MTDTGPLEDLLAAASDSGVPLADVLLKATRVTGLLGDDELKKWARLESTGYPPGEPVPEYRVVSVRVRAQLLQNHYGSTITRTTTLPTSVFPDEVAEHLKTREIRESIRSMVATRSGSASSMLRIDLPASFTSQFNSIPRMQENYTQATDIWLDFSAGQVDSIEAEVRFRITELASSLKGALGGEPAAQGTPPRPEVAQVIQNFNAVFHGDAAGVAVGGRDVTQSVAIEVGKWDDLERAIDGLGIAAEYQAELKEIVESDPPTPTKKSPGAKVFRWLAKMATKASETAVAGATKALMVYYGVE